MQVGVLLAIGVFFLTVKPIQAVIISEVYPQPNTGETEWIELFNPDNSVASIDGWQVYDQLSSPLLLTTLSGSINPNAFLIIHISGAKLNNAGDGVTLLDTTGQVRDEMSYPNSQIGLAWALIGTSWQIMDPAPNALNQSELTPSPSPTNSPATISPHPTLSPTPKPTSANHFNVNDVTLTEVMACPVDGQNEWLEFHNSSDLMIELRNWQIKDSLDQSIAINLDLLPNSYQIFEWSKSLLNNQGDEVKLVSDQGQITIQIKLDACQSGLSWQLISDDWQLNQPSPNQVNQAPLIDPTATSTPILSSSPSFTPSPTPLSVLNHSKLNTYQTPPQPPKVIPPNLSLNAKDQTASVAGASISLNYGLDKTSKTSWKAGLSVIMGGLFFLVAGGLSWYAKKFPNIRPSVA